MTEQEIIANKPEGATHYTLEDDDLWYIMSDGLNVYLWFGVGGWVKEIPNKMLGCEKPL